MTGIIIKRENLDRETHTEGTPCEDEGKGWVIQQREAMPKMASKPPETQRGAQSRRTLRVPRRSQLCRNLGFGLLASKATKL